MDQVPSVPARRPNGLPLKLRHRNALPEGSTLTISETPTDGKKKKAASPAGAKPVTAVRGPRPTLEVEGKVLALRESGMSYAAVARELRIDNAVDAQAAFVRAVRRQPEAERLELVGRESGRLDILESRIRADGASDVERTERRLVALEKLRSALK